VILSAFLCSGALIGVAAAIEILGILGYVRADYNPAYGDAVIPFVFLARLNALRSQCQCCAQGKDAARPERRSRDERRPGGRVRRGHRHQHDGQQWRRIGGRIRRHRQQ
jgi:hypothetical protein